MVNKITRITPPNRPVRHGFQCPQRAWKFEDNFSKHADVDNGIIVEDTAIFFMFLYFVFVLNEVSFTVLFYIILSICFPYNARVQKQIILAYVAIARCHISFSCGPRESTYSVRYTEFWNDCFNTLQALCGFFSNG